MWYAALMRFIRRRLVLAIIFLLSLTYFIVTITKDHHSSSNSDSDQYDLQVKRQQPILWQTNQDYWNLTNDLTKTCRNSVQGRILLIDDRGFVCSRGDLIAATGCCNIELPSTKLYSCDTCDEKTSCCSIYEYCVSCCLNPERKPLLEKVIETANLRQLAVFATVRDQFELCLAKCRTNSHSVQHENKYRNPNKHCYGETQAHESQIDVNGLKLR